MIQHSKHTAALQLWAGLECTVNRVQECFFDQLERSGHDRRIEDLDRFAALGIRTLRYPILWERTAPVGLDSADWSWADARLTRLRELGIRPIVGLIHHGSGPRTTNLLDPTFPEQLARYARAIAERYPWIDYYTPVNEPLTTARFSALYGHWYPHLQDPKAFIQALLIQCRAVVLSMQAIRTINPRAQLIQTEDLGKTFSTPLLEYQADFENERRWATFDLLCGRLDRSTPMWGYFRWAGIEAAELEWFQENPCPPDILGINYYLTSERFLDQHLEYYPSTTHGGNGRHQYADVEAVRVRREGIAGPIELLTETWERYQRPIAVTEVHNGCTREEQMRWLLEIWDAAHAVRCEGIDIRAVTAWSLLGAFDWNSLVTRWAGHYEPGIFDLRGKQLRPTALATMLFDLAQGRRPNHPVLAVPGWWHRPERLIYQCTPPADSHKPVLKADHTSNITCPRPLLITGATGTLGRTFARLCTLRGLSHRLLHRQELDIANPQMVEQIIDQLHPWAIINAAGYVRVDEAEYQRELCFRENTEGPAVLAAACARRDIQLLTFSSDLVFDGTQRSPYVESSPVAPLNVYGQSKAAAEQQVLAQAPSALVVRTSAFFGPWDEYNFVTVVLRTLAAGQMVVAADDAVISPTYVPDLAQTCLDLLIDGECGLWHLSNRTGTTWANLARQVAQQAGYDPGAIEGRPTASLGLAARRPRYSVLGSERGMLLPSLDDAISRYLRDRTI